MLAGALGVGGRGFGSPRCSEDEVWGTAPHSPPPLSRPLAPASAVLSTGFAAPAAPSPAAALPGALTASWPRPPRPGSGADGRAERQAAQLPPRRPRPRPRPGGGLRSGRPGRAGWEVPSLASGGLGAGAAAAPERTRQKMAARLGGGTQGHPLPHPRRAAVSGGRGGAGASSGPRRLPG